MIDQTYYLPMVPGGIPVRVPVSQYDAGAGRNIIFTLIGPNSQAFEVPDGADVTCDGTKKDKKAFSYVVTADGSTVTVPVEEQMTAAAGPVVCQITIYNDGAVLGTANFVLDVERAALADDADMSETDIASLQTWLAEAIAARDAAAASETAAAESVTEAAASATESAASATESANSATAAADSATSAAEAASTAASEAAEATAAEIKESIQTELDAKADQTDLDEVKATADAASAQATTNASDISDLQSSVSELNSNAEMTTLSGTGVTLYYNDYVVVLAFNVTGLSFTSDERTDLTSTIVWPNGVEPTRAFYFQTTVMKSSWTPTGVQLYLRFSNHSSSGDYNISGATNADISSGVLADTRVVPRSFLSIS